MGKDSLTKSTTTKKGSAAKKTAKKKTKSGPKAAAAKKAAPKTSKAKKTVKAKKAAPPKKTTTQAKKTRSAKSTPAKTTKTARGGKRTKAMSVKELLQKQFPGYTPGELYVPPADAPAGDHTAPPFLASTDAEELKRLKALLLRKFDMAAIEAAAQAPKPKAPSKPSAKPASIRELLQKQFPGYAPGELYVPPVGAPAGDYTAPPFLASTDAEELKRLKAALLRKFDMAAIEAAAKAPEPQVSEPKPAESDTEPTPPATAASAPPVAPKPQETPKVKVTYDETDSMKGAEPMDKTLLYAGAAFALIIVFLIGISFANTGNYYLKPVPDGVEIWQGSFAPIGKAKLVRLPGVAQPETIKEVYTKNEVFPMAFSFYLQKADALINVPGTPDFDQIKTILNQALAFAVLPEARAKLKTRLTTIELMTLLYKADVAASRGTAEDLKDAQNLLWQAGGLDLNEFQAEMVERKKEALEQQTPTYPPVAPQADTPTEVADKPAAN